MGKKSRRNKARGGSAQTTAAAVTAADAPPRAPPPVGGGVGAPPNPRLDIRRYSGCSHGCGLAEPGTRAHDLLYHCVAGLNAGVDGFPKPCKNSSELKSLALQITKRMCKDFSDDWSIGTADLSSSLISLGVDLLLMDEVKSEGRVKMAGAIALLVYDLMSNSSSSYEDFDSYEDFSVLESRRKMRDLASSGERDIVNFFNKKVTCGCLKKKYRELKQTQERVGSCGNCLMTLPLKQLMQCSSCKMVQYCSPQCQKIHWEREHRDHCDALTLSSAMELVLKFSLDAAREREDTGTDELLDSVLKRKQVEAFNDPKFRKKYGHLMDLDRLEDGKKDQGYGAKDGDDQDGEQS